jgi:transketolase
MVLLEPSCGAEVAAVVDWCVEEARGPSYIRLVSVPWEIGFSLPTGYRLIFGRGVALTEGTDATIISSGPVMLSEAIKAAARIKQQGGKSVSVVNLPWLNAVDTEWLASVAEKAPVLVTIDNHYIAGGQGEMLAAAVAGLPGQRPRVVRLGLSEVPACGTNDEVLAVHRLDADGIAERLLGELA